MNGLRLYHAVSNAAACIAQTEVAKLCVTKAHIASSKVMQQVFFWLYTARSGLKCLFCTQSRCACNPSLALPPDAINYRNMHIIVEMTTWPPTASASPGAQDGARQFSSASCFKSGIFGQCFQRWLVILVDALIYWSKGQIISLV